MYAQNDCNCPVASLNLYQDKLHPDCSAFFQKPKSNFSVDSSTWYCNVPLGKSKIENFMKDIPISAQLSCTNTNHCIRTTVSTVLSHVGMEAHNLCAVTRHRYDTIMELGEWSGEL